MLRAAAGVGEAAEPDFAPDDLAGLEAWWDFSDATVLFTDDGITNVTADGQAIQRVNDKSGNAHTGSELFAKPIYKVNILNSLSVARVDTTFLVLVAGFGGLTAATAFFVNTAEDPASVNGGAFLSGFGDTGNFDHVPFNDGNVYYGFGSSVRKSVGNVAAALSTARVYAVVTASADWRMYVNGTSVHSTGTNTVDWGANPRLGNGAGAELKGDMAEALIYDSVLDATDMNLVGNYLAAKWGLDWTDI